jgi:hypothetical protein
MTLGFKLHLLLRMEGFKFVGPSNEFGAYSASMLAAYEELKVCTVHPGIMKSKTLFFCYATLSIDPQSVSLCYLFCNVILILFIVVA